MMQFRYGILNLLRSWKKTLAFFLLLSMLTAALGLSAGVCQTAGDFLAQCEDNYVTIAQLEYKATQVLNTDFSPEAAAAAQALELPDYAQWEPNHTALGRLEGLTQSGAGTPAADQGVLLLKISGYDEKMEAYGAYINGCYYSRKDREGQMVYLKPENMDVKPEKGHSYLVHGYFYEPKWSSQPLISPMAFEGPGFDGSVENMLVDVTGQEETCLTDHPEFAQMADYYRTISDAVLVTAAEDLMALYPFHENIYNLTDGESFHTGDGKVLVMSQELAKAQGLAVGDAVKLAVAAKANCGVYEGYWSETGFDQEDTYTIVGLFEGPAEDRNRIYIPAGLVSAMENARSGAVLGQARIPNELGEEFYLSVEPNLPEGVQMTLYDQGYAAAAVPFADILRAARLILLACAAVGIAILALFGYLFIYRQRDVMRNMHRLGVAKDASAVYFLSGSGFLALVSALVGVGLAQALSGRITALVTALLNSYTVVDTRFSITTIGVRKSFAFTPAMETWVFFLTALVLWLCAMAACLLFAGRMMAGRHGQRKAARRRHGQSRSLRGGAWKFAWLSAFRGGGKTLTPLCVLLCAVVLLGLLPFTAQDYVRQQAELEADTTILGYYTNNTGRMADGTSIPTDHLYRLQEAIDVENLTVSHNDNYEYEGYFDKDGNYHGEMPNYWEMSNFAQETFMTRVKRGPKLISANSLPLAPEFRFDSHLKIRWLEGFDESSLFYESPVEERIPQKGGGGSVILRNMRCVVSEKFLRENQLELGDSIYLYYTTDDPWPNQNRFQIIGAYEGGGDQDSIYTELAQYLYNQYFLDVEFAKNKTVDYNKIIWNSAAFTISASRLTDMRDTLEELEYSKIGDLSGQRRWVVLDDRTFLDTQQAMNQRLRYMDILFPVVYAMTELLALAASYLLTMNHKKDLAVMRSQGASRGTGFWSLFLNQLLLCVLGAGIGCGILALTHTWTMLGAMLIGIFMALWLLGSSVSILRMNRREIVKMMKSAE